MKGIKNIKLYGKPNKRVTHKPANMNKIDVIVIGAGVVGLAIARTLALSGRSVIVAEKEKHFGSGISARNSGVIHAGIYYPQNSLKAKLCVKGKESLYQYAKERNVPFRNCSKLIVACDPQDERKLELIKEKAESNGVDDLTFLDAKQAKALEPNLSCTAALLSPSTGIVDIHVLMEKMIIDIEEGQGVIAYCNEISNIYVTKNRITVELSSGEKVQAKNVVNAAGINAQNIANKIESLPQDTIPKQYLAKGNYFGISGKKPFSRLIYPVPEQGGLGVHYTMNLADESLFGPDVEWLHENTEINYQIDQKRAKSFYHSIRRYWPEIEHQELKPAYAGIRPKIAGPGRPDGDFMIQDQTIHGISGLINLYGIESPGLTASLAIADLVRDTLN